MESLHFVEWCLENLNYWTITLLMAIESSFIPLPSEIVIPPAAYKAAEGELNIFLVVFFGTFGALLGSLFNYCLAYFLGRPIIYRFANSKFGKMCLLNEHKVQHAENYFVHKGVGAILLGRLLPGVRHLISIPAGLAKMKLSTFCLCTFVGAGIWNIILAALGYGLHSVVPQDQLMDRIKSYSSEISVGFVVIAVAIVAYLVYRGFAKPKKS